MAPNHRYDLVADSEDSKDELSNLNTSSPIASGWTWWKVVLYILFAASAGFGASFGVVVAGHYLKPDDNAAPAASATTSAASIVPTVSATPSPDLKIPIPSIDDAVDDVEDPDSLAGKVLECGGNPEEARARGCVYDVMMQDWVPEPCFDSILTERFLAAGNYTWYRDPEGHIISDEEMAKGEHGAAWMSGDYHKAHCIFSWEKLIRALRTDQPISQELLSYDHVLHCRMQTLGMGMDVHKREGGIGVKAPTNYAKCAKYTTWQTDFIPDKHSSIEK